MDWRTQLSGLLKDTERNLQRVQSQTGGYALTKKPPSFALLRQGVSPRDPHLIAPAPAPSEPSSDHCDELIAPFYPSPSSSVPPPPPPFEAAGLPAQAGQQLLQAAKLKDELRDMQEQLFMLRQSASSWQQVEATAAGAERQCSATTAKVAALGTDLADLQSSQARMQQASRSSHREVQEKLAALNTQVDALKVQGRGVASATAAELAPLEGRVRQAEEELSALHARLEQQTAAVSAALAAAAASAAAVPEPVSSTPSTSAAELASLQAEVQAMQGAHVSVQQRQDVQREEVLRVSSKLQDVQAAVAAAAKQHTGQLKEFASQHSELGAVRKVAEVHASQIEQLSAQVADVAALVQQQQQQLEQQRQEQLALDVPPVDPEEVRQLSAQVRTSAAAIQDLQQQVGQLSAVQAAVDDANQRLFELRVEFQNAADDAGILASSTKRQAEAAEQQAAEAVDAASDARQLASSLEQEMQGVQQAVASLERRQQGSEQLAQTVDEVAAEVATLKVLLAQQQEAADAAAAAAPEASAGVSQSAVVALSSQLERYGVKAKLGTAVETVACLTMLTEMAHKQQAEAVRLKQGVADAHAAAAAAAAQAAAVEEGLTAVRLAKGGSEVDDDDSRRLSGGSLSALQAQVACLQEQLQASSDAASQQAAAATQEVESTRRQLADVQATTADVAELRLGVAAMQSHFVGVVGGVGQGLAECRASLCAVQQQVEALQRSNTAHVQPQRLDRGQQEQHEPQQDLQQGQQQRDQQRGDQQQQNQQQALEAMQQHVAAMQQQVDAALAASGLLVQEQQQQQELQQERLQEQMRQELEARVLHSEAAVAAAFDRVAAQLAVFTQRIDRAEALAASSATHAEAAAIVAQQHRAVTAAAAAAAPSTVAAAPAQQLVGGEGSNADPAAQNASVGSGARSQLQKQHFEQPPWQPPPASTASLSRQSSLRRTKSLTHSQQQAEAQPAQPAATRSSSGGLLARLGRSFTGRRGREAAGSASASSDAAATSSPAPGARHGGASAGSEGSELGGTAPQAYQYRSRSSSRGKLERHGSSGSDGGEAVQEGSNVHSAVQSPQVSQEASGGTATGDGEACPLSEAHSGSSRALDDMHPICQQPWSPTLAAPHLQERSDKGSGSAVHDAQQPDSMVGEDSSFGEIPLP